MKNDLAQRHTRKSRSMQQQLQSLRARHCQIGPRKGTKAHNSVRGEGQANLAIAIRMTNPT
jgi:hypothetical protein